jgi:hypothetical protein
MSLITIDNLSGTPPYLVYVCDIFQFSCVTATTIYDYIPPAYSFYLPSGFNTAPKVLIKIIDSTGCVYTQEYTCIIPSP